MSATVDKTCKLCHRNPRYTDAEGKVTSAYCSNVCAKKAGAPLPNPEKLVKRAKDLDLSQLLAQEAQIERSKDDPVEPQSVISLAKSGIWKIESKEGTTDVLLSRTYNNEEIRVNFNMAELDPFEPDEDSDDEDDQGGTAQRDEEEDESDDEIPPEPIECRISIAKPRKGALLFECYGSVTGLEILKISYLKDHRLVSEESAENDRKILASGVGPEFDSLPKRIKEEFGKYLNERGIDNSLAQTINDFIKYKTQKEALGWFESVGSFVETQ